ncbi:DUF4013 domain-containing protein [Olsenella profusa]|uniref:DUF4013 domain-containing protein n=1 Tax=Olsenella profusa TaxID=138595 RepID=A0ABS2F0I8_9ACTN|nr:DUF4013 domain-containing protein [Olsenella profusa]MBM6774470.1 DUF4013 domain-containing protein [Olsenella profusa]
MVSENELEGFRRDRYFARSWALLTRDRGWVKPVLVMTVALLVPVVGVLGVMGYVLEWARLTAWGVNSAPKQRDVAVGACIASGWRALVVMVVWGICVGLIGGVLAVVPLLGGLLSFAWTVFGIFLNLVLMAALVRATIYQEIKAGLRVPTIWQMASHDAGGLLRVLGIQVVGSVIIGAITFVVVFATMMSILPQLIYLFEYIAAYESIMSDSMLAGLIISRVISILLSQWPALVVLTLVGGFFGIVVNMLALTSVGLWMRQFNVGAWTREEDPLPPYVSDPRDAGPSYGYGSAPQQPPVPPTPGAPASGPAPSADPAQAAPTAGAPAGTSPDSATPYNVSPTPAAPSPAGEKTDYTDGSWVREVTPAAAAPDAAQVPAAPVVNVAPAAPVQSAPTPVPAASPEPPEPPAASQDGPVAPPAPPEPAAPAQGSEPTSFSPVSEEGPEGPAKPEGPIS